MKKYIANSDISVSVTLPDGKGARISFSALSNGTSVFYTSDKDIQWALEHHYKFGKLFRLAGESAERKPATPKKPGKDKQKPSLPKGGKKVDKTKESDKPVDHPAIADDNIADEMPGVSEDMEDADTGNDTSEDAETPTEYREVVVSDMDAAKDYLAEHYEVVRTKLKSEDSIKDAALSFGIIFKYL